jgi:hypothetical protein
MRPSRKRASPGYSRLLRNVAKVCAVDSRTTRHEITGRGWGLPRSRTNRKHGIENTRNAIATQVKRHSVSADRKPRPMATNEPKYPMPTPMPEILPRLSSVDTSGSNAS